MSQGVAARVLPSLGPFQPTLPKSVIQTVGQGSEFIEGGGTVSQKEVLNLLGETALVCAPKSNVVPSTVSG